MGPDAWTSDARHFMLDRTRAVRAGWVAPLCLLLANHMPLCKSLVLVVPTPEVGKGI